MPEMTRICLWKEEMEGPEKKLTTWKSYIIIIIWKTLNRLRTETGRSTDNVKKWGLKV